MLNSILSLPRSTLSAKQTLDIANSYLKLAREHQDNKNFTVALPFYEQAVITLEKLDPEHRKLSLSYWTGKFRKAAHEPRAEEDQTFKTLLAEVYIERGETFQALGHYTKARASYKNAKKYGHLEADDKLDQLNKLKSLLPAKDFHLFGQRSAHSSRVYLPSPSAAMPAPLLSGSTINDNPTAFFISNPMIEEPQSLDWPKSDKFKNTQELTAFFKQHEEAINGLNQHKEAQEKLTQHEEAIDGLKRPNLSPEKRRALKAQILSQEKKQAFEKLLLSSEQHQALTTHELSKSQQDTLLLLARGVINEFANKKDKTPLDIREVVTLAAMTDLKLQRALIGQFVKAIYEDPLLNDELLNGLAQVIRHLKPGDLNANDGVQILKILHSKQEDLHDNASDDGFVLLQALAVLLDAMADAEINGLSRDQLHSPLYKTLQTLSESEDGRFAFQASYACQALLHVPDDEKLWQSVFRRSLAVGGGVMALANVVRTCDPQKLFEMFEQFGQAFDGLAKVLNTANEIYSQGQALYQEGVNIVDNVRAIREGVSFNFKRPWYTALRYTDFLIQSQQFVALEVFVFQMPIETRKYVHFVTGLSQQLEQVVRSSADLAVRQSALAFLTDLYHNDERWGRLAKPMIMMGLACALQVARAEPAMQQAADTCLRRLAQGLTPYKKTLYQQYVESTRDNTQEEIIEPSLLVSGTLESFPTALLHKLQNAHSLQNINTEFESLNKKLAELTQGWGKDNPAALNNALASLKESYLKETFNLYISLEGKKQGGRAEDTFELEEGVLNFLDSKKEKILLIHGEAGMGKSTFSRHLAQKLWGKSMEGDGIESNKKTIIPVLIPLAAMTNPANNLIPAYLKQQGFSTHAIQKLKQDENQTLVFILDGYDEIAGIQNLYISNELDKWPAKVIISCRTEYLASLGKDYQSKFLPKGDEKESLKAFREIALLPFTDEQIKEYINKYIQQNNPDGWSDKDYWKLIERIPNLKDLVKNPFLLTITIEVLPHLLEPGQEAATAQITRIDLYDQFVRQWFARAKQKLEAKQLAMDEKAAFEDLVHDDFVQCGIEFAKDLAAAIYIHNAGNPVLEYSRFKDALWKQAFFGPGEDQKLLRQAWPLHRIRNQYQFIHKSLLEYFMARAVFEPGASALLAEEAQISALSVAEVPDDSNNVRLRRLSFESERANEKTSANTENISLLFKKNFANHPSVIHFLAERARKEPVFKAQLFDFIECSKDEAQGKDFRKAAANAITILIRAGVQFNSENLEGIQVPGADLSYGSFDSAQLQKADLRNVNFQNAWLRAANLNGAKMEGVQFGEWPGLQQEDRVTVCTYSPDRQTFAVGLANGRINFYGALTWKKRPSLNDHSHTDLVTSIVYSSNGQQIVSASRDATVRLWDPRSGQLTHTLNGHTDEVTSVAYSPNGDHIVSASRDKTIRVWDAQTGESGPILEGHTNDVTSVVYSSNGQYIVSASRDKTVRLWNAQTGKARLTLGSHTSASEITSVVYSPNGKSIASASLDKTIQLWDVQTGAAGLNLQGHASEITSIVYSPTGQRIASASLDKTIRVWDMQSGALRHTLEGHTSEITSVVYSPSGAQIASASRDATIRLWDAQTGALAHTLDGHISEITSVVYSPSGAQIASASRDATVRLWDAQTGALAHTLGSHTSEITSVVYSPSGQHIASASHDATVRLWHAQTGALVHTLDGHTGEITSVVYSPSGQQIASASLDKTIQLWDVKTGAAGLTLEGHTGEITSIVYSPSGQHIASANRDNTIRLWDAQTGALMRTLEGHTSEITSVVYSPSGQHIASASRDKTVRVWDAQTGEFEHILGNHTGEVTSVAYSPTAQQIVSASRDNTIRLWDEETGALTHTLQGHTSEVISVAYSPNGQQIISTSRDATVRLWDMQTGALAHTLNGHASEITSVVYSPNGEQIASASRDNTVRLWDARTGESTNTLSGHTDGVMGAAYLLDGKQLASGSRDKTVRVWPLSTAGTALRVLSGHDAGVMSVAVSTDGRQVVSGSRDSTVRLWDMQTGALAHTLSRHTSTVTSVVYSPNGQQLASASEDKTVRWWDVEIAALACTLGCGTSTLTSVVYSPNGQQLAFASDTTVCAWNVDNDTPTHDLRGHTGAVTSVVYSPNGQELASASEDTTVRVWNVQSGALRHILRAHASAVTSVAYSPNGKQLVSSSDDQTVRLWDAQSGAAMLVLVGHTSAVTSVVYSPNGEQLASGSDDQTVRLWDAQSGEGLAVIAGFSGMVNSIVWKKTFDGDYLVTGSQDKSVRVWQVIANDGQYRVVLRWSSSQETLTAVDTSIQDVQGLSPVSQELLEQRGAVGKPIPPLSFDQTSKQLIGVTAAVSKFKLLSKCRSLDTLPAAQSSLSTGESVRLGPSSNEQSIPPNLA